MNAIKITDTSRIPARYARIVCFVMENQHGVDSKQLTDGTGISNAPTLLPDGLMGFSEYQALCHNAVKLAGTPEIALDIGAQLLLPAHGTIGLAAMTSATLNDAIHLLKHYIPHEIPKLELVSKEQHNYSYLTLCTQATMKKSFLFHLECALTSLVMSIISNVDNKSNIEIHCAYKAPRYADRYRDFFNCKVVFGSEFTGVKIPQNLLTTPMKYASPTSHQMLSNQLQNRYGARKTNKSMTQIITDYLATKKFYYPNQDMVAQKLNVSTRKLRYCLKAENTSFNSIISTLKRRDAYLCLKNGMTINQVAFELGYDEPSNFTRAFRKWYGTSPKDFKQALDFAA